LVNKINNIPSLNNAINSKNKINNIDELGEKDKEILKNVLK
jgi:hypothetical protein